jgi:hypothetical protein
MREEFRTKPDYTGRKTGIDRDDRAVEGNACERRQACSLADLRKRASPFGYPRERVFRQAARVRVKNGRDALEMGCLYYRRKQTSVSCAADCDVVVSCGGAKLGDKHLASMVHCVDDRIIAPRWLNAVESSFIRMCVSSRRMFVS